MSVAMTTSITMPKKYYRLPGGTMNASITTWKPTSILTARLLKGSAYEGTYN
jgi:hypothetical protein